MSDAQGPLMVDLTSLVKKPPLRYALLGMILLEVKQVFAIGLAVFLSMPVVFTMWRFGFERASLFLVMIAGGIGYFATMARPDGQTLTGYALNALRGRIGTVEVDGQKRPVYVGVARVRDFHGGQRFRYARSAVEVLPDKIDDRGALQT